MPFPPVITEPCPLCGGTGQYYHYWRKPEWEAHQKKNASDVLAWLTGQTPSSRIIQETEHTVIEGPFPCTGCRGKGSVRIVHKSPHLQLLVQG